MPPVIWIGATIAGAVFFDRGAKFLDEANQTTKLALLGGAAFAAYRLLK